MGSFWADPNRLSDEVDTTILRRNSYAIFRERGLMAIAGLQAWRRRIITELAATDDEAELNKLTIELKDMWKITKQMVHALEKVREIRGGERPLFSNDDDGETGK